MTRYRRWTSYLWHRLGFHQWKRKRDLQWEREMPGFLYDQRCRSCGAWQEVYAHDDSPWGVRTRSTVNLTVRKAWHP